MRVLFAFFPYCVAYNHGIALLSALCKQRGIETDLCLLDDRDDFKLKMTTQNYDWVAFSSTVRRDYWEMLPFLMAAKGMGHRVLLGGTYVRMGRVDCPQADEICLGEGESLPDFLLGASRHMFRNVEKCHDLNALPLPDYDLFAGIPFDRGLPFLDGKNVMPYYSSRGCPYSCDFCQVQYQPPRVRLRTKVEEDLTHLSSRYAPDIFFIGDELLPYYSEKWRDSWGKFEHPFVSYIRADITTVELQWLIDRGLCGCAFGVESGDETYRNTVLHKNLTDAQIHATVDMLQSHDIPFVPFYMTGTPEETFTIRNKTYRMAQTLGGYPLTWAYEELGA